MFPASDLHVSHILHATDYLPGCRYYADPRVHEEAID